MDYYSAVKKNEILNLWQYGWTWWVLMLSEIGQT